MPRPTLTISGAEARSTVCAEPRNGSPGLVRICEASMVGAKLVTSAVLVPVSPARMAIRAHEPALQQLACECRAFADGYHVADEHLAHACGQRRSEIAHLISVREYHALGLLLLEELMQGNGVSVRRVGSEQRMLNARDLCYGFGFCFCGERFG